MELFLVVCLKNGSFPPPFIASRGRFRDYIWKEPTCNHHGWITRGWHVATGGERRRGGAVCGHTQVAPPCNRPLHVGCMLVRGCVYMGGGPIFFGRVGYFAILWLGYALRLAWLCILHVFSLIIKHVSFKTYKHQNLRNLLVINPILSSVFRINKFYAGFWRLKSCIKDRQHEQPLHDWSD
jgi:hypothetical protein